jgi:hypothetical protein
MNSALRRRLRALARPVYHRLLGPQPVDPTRRWRGTATPGEPALRLAYYGDCAFRAMDRSHSISAPVGWPAVLADRLAARGTALEASLVFVGGYEGLPAGEALTQHLRLSGDPDVVVVQNGAIYTRRILIPDAPWSLRLRDDVGRRLGRFVFAGYRLARPLVRLAGRPSVEYHGAAHLERFLGDVRRRWPEARVVMIPPHRRLIARAEQRRLEVRLIADARLAAERTGVDFLDVSEALPRSRPELRCANGWNYSSAGSELVAERFLGWLDATAPAEHPVAA